MAAAQKCCRGAAQNPKGQAQCLVRPNIWALCLRAPLSPPSRLDGTCLIRSARSWGVQGLCLPFVGLLSNPPPVVSPSYPPQGCVRSCHAAGAELQRKDRHPKNLIVHGDRGPTIGNVSPSGRLVVSGRPGGERHGSRRGGWRAGGRRIKIAVCCSIHSLPFPNTTCKAPIMMTAPPAVALEPGLSCLCRSGTGTGTCCQ